jgi:cytochrome P450
MIWRALISSQDTTAATLHFAITLLAVWPEWQTWIAEEVDQVRQSEQSEIWYYEQTFPRLRRCLALMVGS